MNKPNTTNEELAREILRQESANNAPPGYFIQLAINKATEPLQNELGVLDAELIVAKSENTQLQTNLHAIQMDLSLSIGERNRLFAELTQLKADCEVMRSVVAKCQAVSELLWHSGNDLAPHHRQQVAIISDATINALSTPPSQHRVGGGT